MSAPIRPSTKSDLPPPHRKPGTDLIIRSSDGATFDVSSKDLASFSSGFPDALTLCPSVDAEVVQLTEPAVVLEVVLQLLRNKRPSTRLRCLPAEVIVQVAEAVEKYQIAQSLEICYMCMENVARKVPFKVLEYAFKHGYPELADVVAPFTLCQAFDHRNPPDIHHGTLLAWLLWRNEPQFPEVVSIVSNLNGSLGLSPHAIPSCNPWNKTRDRVAEALRDATDPDDMLQRLDHVLPKNIICGTYGCCMQAAREWRQQAKAFVDAIKPFSFYMKKVAYV